MKKDINSILKSMRNSGKLQDMKGKGDAGEDAVLQLVLERQRHVGGLVYQSFKYPYQTNRQGVTYRGNIIYKEGSYEAIDTKKSGAGLEDEIDVLFVTPYRIFPIEVKSYHAKLEVFNDWMKKQGEMVEKSPIAQAEKHARHLYHAIYEVLPEGRPEYIKPIVCFVDRCTMVDTRREDSIIYLPCCILNTLKSTIINNNTPLRYNIDIPAVRSKLDSVRTDVRKEFV
jgi:hypothetical protein